MLVTFEEAGAVRYSISGSGAMPIWAASFAGFSVSQALPKPPTCSVPPVTPAPQISFSTVNPHSNNDRKKSQSSKPPRIDSS